MRELIPGVAVALMLASTLHAIAVGNCLPAGVETFCVDINQAVVTKLADRGSHQAHGIVTDVGPFLGQLADALMRSSVAASQVPGTCVAGDARARWGRRYLMCPPHHFGVLYEINPWMHEEVAVEHDVRLRSSGTTSSANLRLAGAEVVTMDPQPEVPDLVFTANAGIVNGNQFVPEPLPPPGAAGRDGDQRGLVRGAGLPGRPAARRSSTTRAPATRCRSPPRATTRCSCPGYSFRSDAAAITELGPAARVPDQGRAAGRPAAVPPRPHVLPARRAPRPLRAERLGRLRPQGDRGARARAAVARGGRGAELLRQLGGRRHDDRDAAARRRGSAASSRRGASPWSRARSTSSSRRAAAAGA